MRIVEREGTGMRSGMKSLVAASVLSGALLMSVASSAAAADLTLVVEQCERVSVALVVESQLYTGAAPLQSAYALVSLSAVGGSEGTNAAGEGTGIYSAGEGTGAPETDAAGEGTGLDETLDPGTNAAGEGTGSPQYNAYYVEVLLNQSAGADVLLYKESSAGFSEMSAFSNVAVSGLASGNGCDRE